MEIFKIIFTKGYKKIKNSNEGIIDINVVFKSGSIFHFNLITLNKIKALMEKNCYSSFQEDDMLIVKDLQKESIRKGLKEIIDSGNLEKFSNVNIEERFPGISYEELVDMNDNEEDNCWKSKFKQIPFKVLFPTGYAGIKNIHNDSEDINVIFKTGEVYYGHIITAENIRYLMLDNKAIYFWRQDMFIIEDLKKDTIKNAIKKAIEEDCFQRIFCKLGNISEIYNASNYQQIIDMNDLPGKYLV